MNIDKGYHGNLCLSRQSKFLLQELGCDLYGFYIALVMEAIWYRGNKNFGRIMMTQEELAIKFNMDQGTISRKFKALENRNRYCVIRHKRSITLGFFPLFLQDVASKIHSKNYANWHELYADMHRINAELQENYAISQDNRTQNASQSLRNSSNDSVSFSVNNYGDTEEIDIDEVIEGIERERMIKEGKNEQNR